jgi:4-hydroxy-3-polyprenylbenzoate decarboxylase
MQSAIMPKQKQPAATEGIRLTLAITGASGAVLAREMLRALAADPRVQHVDLIPSEHAHRVIAEELNLSARSNLIEKLLGAKHSPAKIKLHNAADIGAGIASGSHPTNGMIVLPCSMGTLAAIANGLAANLIQRAADVCLKQQRPLLLCLRETPLNRIHLRNMQLAADAGATLFPVMPAFYIRPQSTEEMAREFINRVLAHINLPQPKAFIWKP